MAKRLKLAELTLAEKRLLPPRSLATLTIDNWQPARLNQLLSGHWSKRARLKRQDRDTVFLAASKGILEDGLRFALGKRRVSLEITLAPRQRAGDPDAYWKSLLDALVHAGLLLDDNRQGVELGPVTFIRGPRRATTITLEDL